MNSPLTILKRLLLVLIIGALIMAVIAYAGHADPTDGTNTPVAATTPSSDAVTTEPMATLTPQPSPSPTEVMPSSTPTSTATELPVATEAPTQASANPDFVPTPGISSPISSRYVIGGINFVDPTHPVDIIYPLTLDGDQTYTLSDVDLLVSDADGTNYATFLNIGSWVGKHKIFVYADVLIGSPILSVHDGYWAGTPLAAEALRHAIEGTVANPYTIDVIQVNLADLVGETFTFEQSGRIANFIVSQAVRMDPETTDDYLYRAGELSALLAPIEDPGQTILWLMCSTGQPGEPDETFPARFVLALTYME